MARPLYFVASDNLGIKSGVGQGDIWVRQAPGEPLKRITQGQWSDYYTRDRPDLTKDVFYKNGTWFQLAFDEDNLCHNTYNTLAHPWMVEV
jgi:hypothetical protein